MKDDYGNKYLFVLNRDFYKETNTDINLKIPYRVYMVSKEDGEQRLIYESTQKIHLNLLPGDAELIRIQPSTENAFTIEYVLQE